MDGHVRKENSLVFITTNKPEAVRGVLIRPGRIDKKIEFKLFKKPEMKKMAKHFFRDTEITIIDKIIQMMYDELKSNISAASLQQFFFDILMTHGETITTEIVKSKLEYLKEIQSDEMKLFADDKGDALYA